MALVYVDASVLISAAKGTEALSVPSLRLLDRPASTFVSSEYVRLECLPSALFFHRQGELEFLEAFFQAVSVWVRPSLAVTREAMRYAATGGLGAMDALHVACAIKAGADELVTAEKPTKPINRVAAIRVRTIHPGV
ncbi:MAG: PIN domain-containing protein [Dehalococcoidia bacterium]